MPVRINNMETDVTVTDNDPSGAISEKDLNRIVNIVLNRIREEKALMERINEESGITNKVSKRDLFD